LSLILLIFTEHFDMNISNINLVLNNKTFKYSIFLPKLPKQP